MSDSPTVRLAALVDRIVKRRDLAGQFRKNWGVVVLDRDGSSNEAVHESVAEVFGLIRETREELKNVKGHLDAARFERYEAPLRTFEDALNHINFDGGWSQFANGLGAINETLPFCADAVLELRKVDEVPRDEVVAVRAQVQSLFVDVGSTSFRWRNRH